MNKLIIAAMVVGISLNVLGLALEVPTLVLDLDGNPLISGKQYQMMIGKAAAIGLAKINNTCPFYVVQQSLPSDNAAFITITNQVKQGTAPIAIIKSIIAVNPTSNVDLGCLDSPVWQVVQQVVRTGGKLGVSLFRIAKIAFETDMDMGMSKPVYKLQFCQTIEVNSCQDIGILPDSITSPPAPVVKLLSPIIQGRNIIPLGIQFKNVE